MNTAGMALGRFSLRSRQYIPVRFGEVNSKLSSGHANLIRGGYVHQEAKGLYTYLPAGQRVLAKIEEAIDVEMDSVGASKVSLSRLTKEALWQKTGRAESIGSELMRLHDRHNVPFVLAPTHEESVCDLARAGLDSVKQLPLKLYQVGHKYRDEARPRGGLLRAREFIMKDLYTFDVDSMAAKDTYTEVREAYMRAFARMGVPVVCAVADGGAIGDAFSEEFHMILPAGEDDVARCGACGYTANTEAAVSGVGGKPDPAWSFMSDACAAPTARRIPSLSLPVAELPSTTKVHWYSAFRDTLHLAVVTDGDVDSINEGLLPAPVASAHLAGASSGPEETWKALEVPPTAPTSTKVVFDTSVAMDTTVAMDSTTIAENNDPHWHATTLASPLTDCNTTDVLDAVRRTVGEDGRVPARMLRKAREGDCCPVCSAGGNLPHPHVDHQQHLLTHPEHRNTNMPEIHAVETGAIETETAAARGLLGIVGGAEEEEGYGLERHPHTPIRGPPAREDGRLSIVRGIELGHIFQLGTKYSEASVLDVTYRCPTTKKKVPTSMGCYGIGVSRVMAAAVEATATEDGISLPAQIAPWKVLVTTAAGAAEPLPEDASTKKMKFNDLAKSQMAVALKVAGVLAGDHGRNEDVVLDDRVGRIGARLGDADRIGYPVVVVVGRDFAKNEKFEVQALGEKHSLTLQETREFVDKVVYAH